MPGRDRMPSKPATAATPPGASELASGDPLAREPAGRDRESTTPLKFGPDGEIEFKEAVPRQRDDVLKILREEAAHAAAEERTTPVRQTPIHAGTIDDSKANHSENSQSVVRTGKPRSSDTGGIRAPATSSSGWLRAFIFTLAATLAIAAFAYHFAPAVGIWAPWLQPYLTEYVHSINRLAGSIGELL